MKRFYTVLLCVVFSLPLVTSFPAHAAGESGMVRIGLFYGNAALASANLENSSGSGYRFGYYSGDSFVTLGSSTQTQISMLKTQTIYLKDGQYYATNPGGDSAVIGCYHLELPSRYPDFAQAQAAASAYPGGFPAWNAGQYLVRVGAYATEGDAQAAQGSLGLAGTTVVGSSARGINVTRSKTTELLFQFDGEETFAVKPGLDNSTKTVTWFKGYRYYGDFLYERLDGGNLTVSNYVGMDDYLKGVLPYEMSSSWPLEALKAQAICARNYTLTIGSKHKAQSFDLCNTTCCQVYFGTNKASANSDRAVEDTSGICARYQGKLAQTFYYASNGGASEDVANVWGSTDLPYLAGVKDPYEAAIESNIPGYRWSTSFTADKLASILQAKGYACGRIVDLKVTEYTALGNVFSIAFVDDKGASFPFTRERVRTTLGLKSMRFQISGNGGGAGTGTTGTYSVDEGGTLSALPGAWSIGEDGERAELPSAGLYAITANGTEPLAETSGGSGASNSGSTLFTVTGSGNGHHVGMSQWGAYAMAKQGLTHQDILKFYFTGIDIN